MLSIVATPIGNLGDITLRAVETLKSCSAIVCEDTRVTGNLLKALGIERKELISMHGYSNPRKIEAVLHRLGRGEHIALVSDAGTPGISDPGYALVSRVRACGGNAPEKPGPAGFAFAIQVIPGPSAFLAALSASGLPINQFVYLGFLPLKKGRQTLLQSLKDEERTIVLYESVHRIERTLVELAGALCEQPDRPVVVARELTKMHEEVIPTTVACLPDLAMSITQKGEFVIVIGAQERHKS